MWAAGGGNLDCLEHLVAKGANLKATDRVSAAPPTAPTRLHPRPPPSPPAVPAAPPSPPPLTVCCAAAAPTQDGYTALMLAAVEGEFGCLEHLVTKGANLQAKNRVSAAPPAAPIRLRPRPWPLPPAVPAAPPSPPPLTVCCAAPLSAPPSPALSPPGRPPSLPPSTLPVAAWPDGVGHRQGEGANGDRPAPGERRRHRSAGRPRRPAAYPLYTSLLERVTERLRPTAPSLAAAQQRPCLFPPSRTVPANAPYTYRSAPLIGCC